MSSIHFVMETISSVALSHPDECACVTCRAANGDTTALAVILREMAEKEEKRA